MVTYRTSEIFSSLQGEGTYLGAPSVWIRFFGCPLNCHGFGQKDPTDPTTYDLPYQDFDVSSVKSMEELPVWNKGCDSSYSWASKFKGLAKDYTAEEIYQRLVELLPFGTFVKPAPHNTDTDIDWHLCVTGGEPLLPKFQQAVVELLHHSKLQSNTPRHITFETNGTRALSPQFIDVIGNRGIFDGELFFSVSPKLFTVSGEQRSKAIHPQIVKQYQDLSPHGQLKFVVGTNPRQWDELEEAIGLFRSAGVLFPIWTMAVGATDEGQAETAEYVANESLRRGYNFSPRSHVDIYGNKIGT